MMKYVANFEKSMSNNYEWIALFTKSLLVLVLRWGNTELIIFIKLKQVTLKAHFIQLK